MEPLYGAAIQLARLTWRLQGLRFTVRGVEHLPATGGAVIAINHTGYFDFTFAGLPAYLDWISSATLAPHSRDHSPISQEP